MLTGNWNDVTWTKLRNHYVSITSHNYFLITGHKQVTRWLTPTCNCRHFTCTQCDRCSDDLQILHTKWYCCTIFHKLWTVNFSCCRFNPSAFSKCTVFHYPDDRWFPYAEAFMRLYSKHVKDSWVKCAIMHKPVLFFTFIKREAEKVRLCASICLNYINFWPEGSALPSELEWNPVEVQGLTQASGGEVTEPSEVANTMINWMGNMSMHCWHRRTSSGFELDARHRQGYNKLCKDVDFGIITPVSQSASQKIKANSTIQSTETIFALYIPSFCARFWLQQLQFRNWIPKKWWLCLLTDN